MNETTKLLRVIDSKGDDLQASAQTAVEEEERKKKCPSNEEENKFIMDMFNEEHKKRIDYIRQMNYTDQIFPVGELCDNTFDKFFIADAKLYINPILGIKEWNKSGDKSLLSVQIGLVIKCSARLGVIHIPYAEEDSGLTYFGSAEHGVYSVKYKTEMSDNDKLMANRDLSFHDRFNKNFKEPQIDETTEIRVAGLCQSHASF